MANQGSSKDGWRTKGVKQLRTKEIIRACQLSDELEKQGIGHTITIFCNHDFEIQRARDAWAAFKDHSTGGLIYKKVVVLKV